MSEITDSRHTGIVGTDAADRAEALRAHSRVPVSVFTENSAPARPFTTVLVFADAPGELSWRDWFAEMKQTEESFDRILPRLANPAKLLVIGTSSGIGERERAASREFLSDVTTGVGAYATTEFGLDLSVNAVEVPPRGDDRLLLERLARFAEHGHVAADGHVLAREEIAHDSLAVALATTEI